MTAATPEQQKVLVVDDDPQMRSLLVEVLQREGLNVASASSGEEALVRGAEEEYALVISDMNMKGMDGMALLTEWKARWPDTTFIMVTAFGSIQMAIDAMQRGAYHFITKPFKMADVIVVIRKGLDESHLRHENRSLRRTVERRYGMASMVGRSRAMQEVFDLVEIVARTTSTVLLQGESGTGKELVARAIHTGGSRARRPFVAVNCAAIPEGLLESELFGHVKGAFTGAIVSKKGLFQAAEGGTLFLDEIGDLSGALQAKLLRVLQEKQVRPVGGNETIDIDSRIITATHRDLPDLVKKGAFREDLFYRLSVIPVRIPPLRERREDIPALVEHFLKRLAEEQNLASKTFSAEALDALGRYAWPGNVRELENVVERLLALSRSNPISLADLPDNIRTVDAALSHDTRLRIDRRMTLEDLERQYILQVLDETSWHREKAAHILGINRRTIYRKLRAWGIASDEPEPGEDELE